MIFSIDTIINKIINFNTILLNTGLIWGIFVLLLQPVACLLIRICISFTISANSGQSSMSIFSFKLHKFFVECFVPILYEFTFLIKSYFTNSKIDYFLA